MQRHIGTSALLALALFQLSLASCTRTATLEVDSVDPSEGQKGRSVAVQILGRFQPLVRGNYDDPDRSRVDLDFQAALGEHALQQVEYVDDARLRALVPATLPVGTYDLLVTDPRGQSASLAGAFTVRGEPWDGSTDLYDAGSGDGPEGDGPKPDGPRPDTKPPPDLKPSPDYPKAPDGFVCPPQCTGCKGTVCVLDCQTGCTCPAGLDCEIDCGPSSSCTGPINCSSAKSCAIVCGPDSCQDAINCNGAESCTIICSGGSSCHNAITCGTSKTCVVDCGGKDSCKNAVTCGTGNTTDCTITCSGSKSCQNSIDCSKACACSVNCTGGTCTGGVSCPSKCSACTPADNCDNC
jgi:hypothetical protein